VHKANSVHIEVYVLINILPHLLSRATSNGQCGLILMGLFFLASQRLGEQIS